MAKSIYTVLVIAVGILAIFLARRSPVETPPLVTRPSGRNNTVLFLADSHHGRVNVHLAACLGLLEHHPEVEVHFASFAKMAPEISRLSKAIQARPDRSSATVHWHEVRGLGVAEGTARSLGFGHDQLAEAMTLAPGVSNVRKLTRLFLSVFTAWTVDEYVDIYESAYATIERVDPAIIVADGILMPHISAIRALNRSRVYISPDMLSVEMSLSQPEAVPPWIYPSVGSGYSFPLSWSQSVGNSWIAIRVMLAAVFDSRMKRDNAELARRGIAGPLTVMGEWRGTTIISSSFAEGTWPIKSVPENIVTCGPLILDIESNSTYEQDAGLGDWLKQAPTVLINLGSLTKYDETSAQTMVSALLPVFERTGVQVLWKFRPAASVKDEGFTRKALQPLQEYIDGGRLKVVRWLTVDPPSLLLTGNIVLSVHHGGANCFNEATYAGVPQIVLPMWADCYNFATMAEYLGVGIWASKTTAPSWSTSELTAAFLALLDSKSPVREAAIQKASELSRVARSYGGRKCAADKLADLAIVKDVSRAESI